MTRRRPRLRRWAIGLGAYALLLVLSARVAPLGLPPSPRPGAHTASVTTPVYTAGGPVEGADRASITLADWSPPQPRGAPVLFLHGSPGDRNNAALLGLEALAAGRRLISPDLPGFGDSSSGLPDLGARAHARYMLALLDELAIERAHVIGWSNGGGVALHMADLAPDRVASLTLLASVGPQETEGSGDYLFEHAKYRAGWWALRALQVLTPDFGLLGHADDLNWLRNFDETDQRPLRGIMQRTRVPTLIVHGRHDFLLPAWAAQRHYALMPASRMVMLDAGHFIPFLQADEAAAILLPFFDRHDTPGVAPEAGYEDRAPLPDRAGAAARIAWIGHQVRGLAWWLLIPAIALLARWRPELATVLAGMFVARGDLDVVVALLGLFAGRLLHPRTPFDLRRLPLGWLATAAWTGLAFLLVFIAEQGSLLAIGPDDAAMRFGLVGFVLWLILASLALHVLRNLWRRRGRQRLAAQFRRLTRHEYWPNWAIYLPVYPIWLSRLFKPGGVMGFTAANPGIACGGGIVGESKHDILTALGPDPRVPPHALIPAGPDPEARARLALEAITTRDDLAGFPVILKPDAGYRGIDVHLARSARDVHVFFERVTHAAIVQRYAPGPAEYGVMWARRPGTVASLPEGGPVGDVTSITVKVFSTVTGDGHRTLAQLLLDHPRHRCQAKVFFARFADLLEWVVPEGERVRLAQAGNHAQGTEFRDGAPLITAPLAKAIDHMAANFAGGFDFGRFDIRCASDEDLAAGRGLQVVELNGVMSESTNLYDPCRSVWWAWGVLGDQWRRLYAVADARIAAGATPLTFGQFLRLLRHRRTPTTVTD